MRRPHRSWSCAVLLAASCALVACGGGGGGGGSNPPQEVAPRLVVADAVVAPGGDTGVLEVALAGEAPFPVMLQFDVVVDPADVTLDPSVVALATVGRLEAHLAGPGRLRVVCGDATGRPGAPLLPGALVRIPLRVATGADGGPFEARIESQIATDGQGAAPAFDAAPRTATIRRG